MQQRRAQNRFLCAELARVSWTIGAERHETGEAILEDICHTGGCVQLDEPVPVGAVIMLTFRGQKFDGRVRYCVAGEFGYFVGIRFAANTPWSTDLAVPAHLTSLDTETLQIPRAH